MAWSGVFNIYILASSSSCGAVGISDTMSICRARVFTPFLTLSCVSTDSGGGDDACWDGRMRGGRRIVGEESWMKNCEG